MPDLSDRTRRENDLSASLLAALVALRKSIDAGRPDWGTFRADVQSALFGSISDTFAAAAEQLAKLHGEGKGDQVDVTSGANTYASTIAAKIAFDAMANTQAATNDTANADVDRWFSKGRADIIAITETTAAISAGSSLAAVELALLLGRRTTWFWQTEEDDSVCSVCAPLNNREQPDIEPPAHPGCRCTKRYDFSRSLLEAAA